MSDKDYTYANEQEDNYPTPPNSSLRDTVLALVREAIELDWEHDDNLIPLPYRATDEIMQAVQATLLQVIGQDEDLYFGKPHGINDEFSFDHSADARNGLRKEQRQRAIELTNINLKRGITE